jgi:hypothetical protein
MLFCKLLIYIGLNIGIVLAYKYIVDKTISTFPKLIHKGLSMKFAFIPKASYSIGQIITVHGKKMRVESYTHTGKNVTVTTLLGAPKFERIVCICTDSQPIEGVAA